MNEMQKTIYCIRNRATGRVYVGMTKNPTRRFEQHLSALRGGRHKNELMQEDFCKYGNVFSLEILSTDAHCQEHAEQKWILKFKSYDRKYGYNYKDPSIFRKDGNYAKSVEKALKEDVDSIIN